MTADRTLLWFLTLLLLLAVTAALRERSRQQHLLPPTGRELIYELPLAPGWDAAPPDGLAGAFDLPPGPPAPEPPAAPQQPPQVIWGGPPLAPGKLSP